jgi:hypothetical protein
MTVYFSAEDLDSELISLDRSKVETLPVLEDLKREFEPNLSEYSAFVQVDLENKMDMVCLNVIVPNKSHIPDVLRRARPFVKHPLVLQPHGSLDTPSSRRWLSKPADGRGLGLELTTTNQGAGCRQVQVGVREVPVYEIHCDGEGIAMEDI